jgi:hypothetical protein
VSEDKLVFLTDSGIVQDFMDNNAVWKDMVTMLEVNLETIKMSLIDETSVDEIRVLQGQARTTENMLNLPDDLYTVFKNKEDDKANE